MEEFIWDATMAADASRGVGDTPSSMASRHVEQWFFDGSRLDSTGDSPWFTRSGMSGTSAHAGHMASGDGLDYRCAPNDMWWRGLRIRCVVPRALACHVLALQGAWEGNPRRASSVQAVVNGLYQDIAAPADGPADCQEFYYSGHS